MRHEGCGAGQRKFGLRVSNVLLCVSTEEGIVGLVRERARERESERKIPNLAV